MSNSLVQKLKRPTEPAWIDGRFVHDKNLRDFPKGVFCLGSLDASQRWPHMSTSLIKAQEPVAAAAAAVVAIAKAALHLCFFVANAVQAAHEQS